MDQSRAAISQQAGFTLMELMVTVVIIGILAAVGMPIYSDYVTRGRIPQATGNLASTRVKLEQFFQDNHTYVGACVAGTVAPLPESDDFVYSCDKLTASTFVVQAEGRGPMAGFTYTINESNQKSTTALPSGWGSVPVSCWVRKKGGAC